MPIYRYKCWRCDYYRECWNSPVNPLPVPCTNCGDLEMTKVPHGAISVTWNGNKPSDGGITPLVQQMIADAPRARDELTAQKEQE